MFTLTEVLKSLAPWFTAAIVVVLSPMVKDHIPVVVSNYLFSIYEDYFYSRLTFTNIEEYGDITRDQIYEAATIYLRKKINDSAEAKRFICRKTLKQNKPICDIAREDAVIDNFRGIRLEWKLHRAEKIQREEQGIRLYSPNCYPGMPLTTGQEWSCAILQHPATFDKLAMSPERKRNLKEDLDRFVQRKEWYKKVGRAWKRGYLIYGPPDCAQLAKRGEEKKDPGKYYKYTLSGFLNAMDGLWSSCGEEQIIVFTTNHKDLLDRHDPALFRPGRIDMHVPMSYCTMDAFKMLASTYLDFNEDHRLYGQIEGLFANAEVTPAEIAEEFSRTEDPDAALKAIVELLDLKQKIELENAIDV
ncbi:hypothetical protein ACB094_07G165800 [Castanea mollissima]